MDIISEKYKVKNSIKAKLIDIKKEDNLHLLTFQKDDIFIKVLILQLNLDLKIGDEANLHIKPTKLFLSNEKINFENVIKTNIVSINKGKLLSSIICDIKGDLMEVIMLNDFEINKEAYLVFKSTDVSVER